LAVFATERLGDKDGLVAEGVSQSD